MLNKNTQEIKYGCNIPEVMNVTRGSYQYVSKKLNEMVSNDSVVIIKDWIVQNIDIDLEKILEIQDKISRGYFNDKL